MKKIILLLSLFHFCLSHGQNDPLWTRIAADNSAPSEKLERNANPESFQVFALDLNLLKSRLAAAPKKGNPQGIRDVVISLPMPSGTLEHFRVFESSVMHPDLAARYPDIKSYVGKGIDNPTSAVYFSTTIFGLHTMTFSDGGTYFIDPYTKDLKKYIVYSKSSLTQPFPFSCGTLDESDEPAGTSSKSPNSTQSDAGIFKTYRLALSCTIEYAAFHINLAGLNSGTTAQKKAAVLAAMTVTMTRVNGVYSTEMAVRLQMIANNDQLITIDSDSFDNANGPALLGQNQSFVDNIIGNGNYDIGHIFSTGGGGIAQLSSVCGSGSKAMGVTGSGAPINDAFNIDYVAHEMGHQFGASHTFNSQQSSCANPNRSPQGTSAVEPGSGTTIMAYAGICSPDNVQPHSDAYFSFKSLEQIDQHIEGAGNCAVNVVMDNHAPVIPPLQNYTIPKSTAFVLTGRATDAENDALTYCWEEADLGGTSFTQLPAATNTGGPNFRSKSPTASPERYFPALNTSSVWEVLPSVPRVMNFALTVRDNNFLEGGQTSRSNITVTVANVGPFTVTSPNTAVSWAAGSSQNVTWDVAGTTGNGINVFYVDIYLSTNGGTSYPTLLASKVPNDGSELITVPNTPGSSNKIMVRANKHIFYDVSNSNFTITAAPSTFAVDFNGVAGQQNRGGCPGSDVVYTLNYRAYAGFSGSSTLSLTGNPPGTTVSFSPNPVTASGPVTLTIGNTASAPEGFYPMVLSASSGATTKTFNLYTDLQEAIFTVIALSTPENNATSQPLSPTLTWAEDFFGATSYDVQVATDSGFTNIITNANVTGGSYPLAGLSSLTDYYWRVAPRHDSCAGSFSGAFKFTTQTSMGVDERSQTRFSVYPNPSNGSFTVKSDHALASGQAAIQVYDMRGRVVFEQQYKPGETLNQHVELKGVQAGVYLLSVADGPDREVKRIIIE